MIIGIAGLAGTGKDEACKQLSKFVRVKQVSFAEPLKRGLVAMFGDVGVTNTHVFGPSHWRALQIADWCFDRTSDPITVRHALQTLGTEWARNCLYQNVWVDLAIVRSQQLLDSGEADVVVITDVRFRNELSALAAVNAELWHIERPGAGLAGKTGQHPSERELRRPNWWRRNILRRRWLLEDLRTEHIVNDGTLQDLERKCWCALQLAQARSTTAPQLGRIVPLHRNAPQ